MKILIELYTESLARWPKFGQHILAHQTEDLIVVYQAYKPAIAEFSVRDQYLGGPGFSFERMSWIKPNFLWMMYRCGWAQKQDQERVLALWITKSEFEKVLAQSVFSSFKPGIYNDHEHWRRELEQSEVRLQWDPDHDPFGNKVDRRAIQLGLKCNALKNFAQQIIAIEDMTDFVVKQKSLLDTTGLTNLLVPMETVFIPSDDKLSVRIALDRRDL